MKFCLTCNKLKALDQFGVKNANKNSLNPNCRECHNKRAREEYRRNGTSIARRASHDKWVENNRERFNRNNLNATYKRRYGKTLDDKERMFEEQGRCCALCKKTKTQTKFAWHLDHDKKTGRVRGVLCHSCNTALGQYESFILPNLDAVTAYLRK